MPTALKQPQDQNKKLEQSEVARGTSRQHKSAYGITKVSGTSRQHKSGYSGITTGGIDRISGREIGQFAQALGVAMEKKRVSLGDLATELENSYEHTRKLARGLAYPSKPRLRHISQYLNVDFKDMQKLVTIDRLRKKYGDMTDVVAGRDPELQPFYELAARLTPEQRKTWMALGKTLQKTT